MGSQRGFLGERNPKSSMVVYKAVRVIDKEVIWGWSLSAPFRSSSLGNDPSCLKINLVSDRPRFKAGYTLSRMCDAVNDASPPWVSICQGPDVESASMVVSLFAEAVPQWCSE